MEMLQAIPWLTPSKHPASATAFRVGVTVLGHLGHHPQQESSSLLPLLPNPFTVCGWKRTLSRQDNSMRTQHRHRQMLTLLVLLVLKSHKDVFVPSAIKEKQVM